MKSNLQSKLGRKITDEELNSIDDLNTIDSSVVEEIRLLEQYADKALCTNDAKKTLEGLIKEKQNYNWENEDIPGFCGDDTWYQ